MKKLYFLLAILIITMIAGCSKEKVPDEKPSEDKPPAVTVEINDKSYKTILGSYCWKEVCDDKEEPKDLLKGKKTIKVKPGETVTLKMDYKPLPNTNLLVRNYKDKETGTDFKDSQFVAPKEKGIHYYSYGVWWTEDEKAKVSNGGSYYGFALEVE